MCVCVCVCVWLWTINPSYRKLSNSYRTIFMKQINQKTILLL